MKLYNVCTLDTYENDMGLFDSKYHSTYILRENAVSFCKTMNHIKHMVNRVVKIYSRVRTSHYDYLLDRYNVTIDALFEDDVLRKHIDDEVERVTLELDDKILQKYTVIAKYQAMIMDNLMNVTYYIEDIETVD